MGDRNQAVVNAAVGERTVFQIWKTTTHENRRIIIVMNSDLTTGCHSSAEVGDSHRCAVGIADSDNHIETAEEQ